jgi:ABC-type lipoprotein release transport system permease subunit
MAREQLEDIVAERLIKRKKTASILLVILIAAIVLDSAALIYELIFGNGFQTYLFVPAVSCFVIAIIMYSGLQKIKEELAKRNTEL